MPRVLLTGMSGTGKSTLITTLASRGHRTLDTDYGGWVLPDGRWDAPRMAALLEREDTIAVAGTVQNQGGFADRFDHVVLLSAPLNVLLQRVCARDTNPYGRTAADRAEIAQYLRTVEPLLRRTATLELDATAEPATLADTIEALLTGTG
jgi:dephospho-CoA kinase